jgi:hypothetical protein
LNPTTILLLTAPTGVVATDWAVAAVPRARKAAKSAAEAALQATRVREEAGATRRGFWRGMIPLFIGFAARFQLRISAQIRTVTPGKTLGTDKLSEDKDLTASSGICWYR